MECLFEQLVTYPVNYLNYLRIIVVFRLSIHGTSTGLYALICINQIITTLTHTRYVFPSVVVNENIT